MKWVTRKQIRVNRIATAWLIRRFIDPQAEFIFVEPDQVAEMQTQQGRKRLRRARGNVSAQRRPGTLFLRSARR